MSARLTTEHWLPIVGFDGYEVSDLGRVRSLERRIATRWPGSTRLLRGRIMVQSPTKRALRGERHRWVVTLHDGLGGKRWAYVHQLVLEAFIGPRPDGAMSRHLDGDPRNNQLINLAWGARQENDDDSMRLGLIHRGEQHGEAKLTEDQVREIRCLRAAKVAGPRIAKQFGVTPHLIYLIEQRKAWKHV